MRRGLVASIMSTRYVEVLESVHDKITFVGKIRENSKRLGVKTERNIAACGLNRLAELLN